MQNETIDTLFFGFYNDTIIEVCPTKGNLTTYTLGGDNGKRQINQSLLF